MRWIEDTTSDKRNFEIDYTFHRFFIKTTFISIVERIRIVKYPGSGIVLIYNRFTAMADKHIENHMYGYSFINKIISYTIDIHGEDSIIESKYMKIKQIENIVKKHFISYIRDEKLNKILKD